MKTKRYLIATVSVDENGVCSMGYLGDVVGQGGLQIGTDRIQGDPEAICSFLRSQLDKHLEMYQQRAIDGGV